jgi:hypothetical protein
VYLDAAERTISALHEEYPEHAASYLQSRIRRLAGRQFAISVAHQTADVPLVRVKPDGRTTVSLTVCVHNQTSDQQWQSQVRRRSRRRFAFDGRQQQRQIRRRIRRRFRRRGLF